MNEPFTAYRTGVYLVHLSQPHYHAQHYLGYAHDIDARLMQHWQGPRTKASKFLFHVRGLGITWELVRVWVNGTPGLESELKARHNGRLLCPICNPTGRLGTDTYISNYDPSIAEQEIPF